MNDEIRNFTRGALAGMVSRTITAPLDLYKLQLQNPFMPSKNLYHVIQRDGFRHLWKGNLSNCLRIMPNQAINLMAFERTRENLNISSPSASSFISGIVAGSISTLSTYPLETLRVRLALQDYASKYRGIWDAVRSTPKRHWYQGAGICMIGFPLFNAISFSVHSRMKKYFNLSIYSEIVRGGIAGSTAITFTYPTDLLRRRMQLQGFNDNIPEYKNLRHAIRQIYLAEGIRGFYRGLGMCYLKIFPTTGIYFYIIRKTRLN